VQRFTRPTSLRRKEGALEARSAGKQGQCACCSLWRGGRRNRPVTSGTLSPAKQWDSGQLVARVVLDHSRPLETRPGRGGGAALSVCRNLVRAASFNAGVCGACHGAAEQSSSCRMIRNDTLQAPLGLGAPFLVEQNGAGCTTASRVFPPAPVRMQRGWQGDTGQRPGQAESAANRRRLVRCDGVDVQVHLPQVGEARNSSVLHALLMLRGAGLAASLRL
jgi:hypothetical protein